MLTSDFRSAPVSPIGLTFRPTDEGYEPSHVAVMIKLRCTTPRLLAWQQLDVAVATHLGVQLR
jgi:hypothetical protein